MSSADGPSTPATIGERRASLPSPSAAVHFPPDSAQAAAMPEIKAMKIGQNAMGWASDVIGSGARSANCGVKPKMVQMNNH